MIHYRSLQKWKYQLVEAYKVLTPIRGFEYSNHFLHLQESGKLIVKPGYCWDGPSGPTWDTPSVMRPSLVHDVFYQLMREGAVSSEQRKAVDEFFHFQCLEAGMGKFRAWYFWRAVRTFGAKYAKKEKRPPSQRMTAP